MKRAVSISLGSSRRDKRVETVLKGQPVVLERIGTDGDQGRMRQLFLELDGQVDAFGFGGADLGLEVNHRYYPLHSVARLVEGLRTPVVDGSGIRKLVERETARRMEPLLPGPVHPRRALFCVGVARYHMALGFLEAGYQLRFGDLAFGLGIPVFLRSLSALHLLAPLVLPIMGRLPFEWLYPTGPAQERIVPRFRSQYAWATVIADDFHYIRRHLPERLEGKIVVTNTTTPEDVALLQDRGVACLVTTTPRLEGRTFGTNVVEAALVALAGKGRPLTLEELDTLLDDADRTPTVVCLDRMQSGAEPRPARSPAAQEAESHRPSTAHPEIS